MRSDVTYFDWLCNFVWIGEPDSGFRPLMFELYRRNFYSTIEMDQNRILDGLALRKRFFEETGIFVDPSEPCSVLEMLIALAQRIEIDIMWDPEQGDRTAKWFWEMMANLGLDIFYDEFDPEYDYYAIDCIMNTFLGRSYSPSGIGGLFPLRNPQQDQRTVEIWYQMNRYFIENYLCAVG